MKLSKLARKKYRTRYNNPTTLIRPINNKIIPLAKTEV